LLEREERQRREREITHNRSKAAVGVQPPPRLDASGGRHALEVPPHAGVRRLVGRDPERPHLLHVGGGAVLPLRRRHCPLDDVVRVVRHEHVASREETTVSILVTKIWSVNRRPNLTKSYKKHAEVISLFETKGKSTPTPNRGKASRKADMISSGRTIKKISRTQAATHAVPMLMLILLCVAGVPASADTPADELPLVGAAAAAGGEPAARAESQPTWGGGPAYPTYARNVFVKWAADRPPGNDAKQSVGQALGCEFIDEPVDGDDGDDGIGFFRCPDTKSATTAVSRISGQYASSDVQAQGKRLIGA
jgi:hypothetical protein